MAIKAQMQAHGKASPCDHPTDFDLLRRLLDALIQD